MGATREPTCGRESMNPSLARPRRASRTGTRETSYRWASEASVTRAPGVSTPAMMSRRIASCTEGRTMAGSTGSSGESGTGDGS